MSRREVGVTWRTAPGDMCVCVCLTMGGPWGRWVGEVWWDESREKGVDESFTGKGRDLRDSPYRRGVTTTVERGD